MGKLMRKYSIFNLEGRFVCNVFNHDLRDVNWRMMPLVVPEHRYVVTSFVDDDFDSFDTIEGVCTMQLRREGLPDRIVSDGYKFDDHKYQICVHGFASVVLQIDVFCDGTGDAPLLEVVKRFSEMGCSVYCARTGHEMKYEAGTSNIVAYIFNIVG